ncbi:MAG TPA: BadF/BadG/BcrA/BcrD ATPase family protein [Ignavibacteriaceae bacterium]|nr:BadF/BadG/BcrA/BcrD ATPase family protein [Ignavibacteriaceae bacterium]
MKYLVGIDGGGTKTKCAVADFKGNIIFETTGGPSNFLVYGLDKVSETIFLLLEDCCKNLNCQFEDFIFIVLGSAGAGRTEDAENLEKHFLNYSKSKQASIKNFKVVSDARIALEGAFSGRPGSILISGTGSIMFGKDSRGEIHRVGGFGRFIGDEGSGYSIGRKALKEVSKFYDGRGKSTLITTLIANHFGINNSEKLINAVYKNNFDIASVAEHVIYAAKKDDQACKKIIDEETDELIFHIQAMKEKLKQEVLEISFSGSIITNDNFFSNMLTKKINETFKDVKIKEPENHPVMGAIIIAKELLNKI